MGDYVQRFMQDQGPLGPHPKHYAGGWIEVICGSMFSGKTEELIRRVKRAQIARQKVQVFKPHIDMRYATGQVASHNGVLHTAVPVRNSSRNRSRLSSPIPPWWLSTKASSSMRHFELAAELAHERRARHHRRASTSISGASRSAPCPRLMAEAEMVDKLQAICVMCGAPPAAPSA